jgi:hypothetical protein
MKTLGIGILSSVLMLSFLTGPSAAQQDPGNGQDTTNLIDFTIFPRTDPFQSDEIIKISLKFDLKTFIRTKHKEEYLPAELTICNLDPDTIRKNIRVRARGITRKSICYLPPIKLNFKESETGSDSLDDISSLKLVTHCKNSDTYEQYVFKEFLVYRMYNLLTDSSFRVKLLRIDYLDSEERMKPMTRYGFMIESYSGLAERLQGIRLERSGVNTWDTDTYHTNLMAVFQYMIGNTDWAIPVPHNFKLVKPLEPLSRILAIPYDFDYSGMVNTVYAVPDVNLNIESVRVRVYRGFCLPAKEDYQRLFNVFIKNKQAMFSLVENFELLNKKSKREMTEYLAAFYEIIETPWRAEREIIASCRPLPR